MNDRTAPRTTHRSTTMIRTVIGLSAAAVVAVLGHPLFAIVIGSVAVALGVVSAVLPAAAAWIDRAITALTHAIGRVLTELLLALLYLCWFVPAGLFNRAFRRDLLGSRYDASRATYWEQATAPASERLRHWQFSVEPSRGSTAGSGGWLSTALRFALVVGGLVLVNFVAGYTLRRIEHPVTRFYLPYAKMPAYHGKPWAADFFKEYGQLHTIYPGILGKISTDLAGSHINISNGIRSSYNGALASDPGAVTVYFFGGSTMWGLGARDDHTIASEFARLAERDGIAVRVTNHAELGWVSWQEVLRLAQLAAAGDAPNLAIFYDGHNDVWAQARRADTPRRAPRLFAAEHRHALEHPYKPMGFMRHYSALHLIKDYFDGKRGMYVNEDGQQSGLLELPELSTERQSELKKKAQQVAQHYHSAIDLAHRLSVSYGFAVAAFWQPNVYTKTLVRGENTVVPGQTADVGPLYRLATKLIDQQRIHLLTDTLNDLREATFSDDCHINELGNQTIAAAIYRAIKPALLHAARTRRTASEKRVARLAAGSHQ